MYINRAIIKCSRFNSSFCIILLTILQAIIMILKGNRVSMLRANSQNAILFIVFTMIPSFVTAQEDNSYFSGEKTFYGGLLLGANASQIDGDGFSGYHKLGLNVGATVYWHFIPKVGVNLELLYSQKGSRGVHQSESPYFGAYFEQYRIHLNYVEVPLIVNYFISQKYHIGVGASYNALVSHKETYEAVSQYFIDPDVYLFNRYFVDMIVSGSMMIKNGLLVNARYQYGLTPVRDAFYVPQGLGGGRHQMSNMFTLRLAYLF